MTNQEILDNAPEGATSVNKHNQYLWFDGEESFVFNPEEKEWVLTFYEECALEGFRSLADIRRIAELEEKHEELRIRCVKALLVGDATNNAQKMIEALEKQGE